MKDRTEGRKLEERKAASQGAYRAAALSSTEDDRSIHDFDSEVPLSRYGGSSYGASDLF